MRSAIITDSPGKKLLISVQSSNAAKSSKKQKSKAGKKLAFSKFSSNTNEGSFSESNEDDVIYDDSSKDSNENFSDFDHKTAIIPQIGNYVVVKFDDKGLLHFVGQILTDKDERMMTMKYYFYAAIPNAMNLLNQQWMIFIQYPLLMLLWFFLVHAMGQLNVQKGLKSLQ